MGIIYARLGRKDDAIREGRAAVALRRLSGDALDEAQAAVWLAEILVVVGEQEQALDQLQSLLDATGGRGLADRAFALDPLWAPLKGNPRFEALLKKYGI